MVVFVARNCWVSYSHSASLHTIQKAPTSLTCYFPPIHCLLCNWGDNRGGWLHGCMSSLLLHLSFLQCTLCFSLGASEIHPLFNQCCSFAHPRLWLACLSSKEWQTQRDHKYKVDIWFFSIIGAAGLYGFWISTAMAHSIPVAVMSMLNRKMSIIKPIRDFSVSFSSPSMIVKCVENPWFLLRHILLPNLSRGHLEWACKPSLTSGSPFWFCPHSPMRKK